MTGEPAEETRPALAAGSVRGEGRVVRRCANDRGKHACPRGALRHRPRGVDEPRDIPRAWPREAGSTAGLGDESIGARTVISGDGCRESWPGLAGEPVHTSPGHGFGVARRRQPTAVRGEGIGLGSRSGSGCVRGKGAGRSRRHGGVRGRRSGTEESEDDREQPSGGQQATDREDSLDELPGAGHEPRHPVGPGQDGVVSGNGRGHTPSSGRRRPPLLLRHACHVASPKLLGRPAWAGLNPSTESHASTTASQWDGFPKEPLSNRPGSGQAPGPRTGANPPAPARPPHGTSRRSPSPPEA
jgi:hypothetical protein